MPFCRHGRPLLALPHHHCRQRKGENVTFSTDTGAQPLSPAADAACLTPNTTASSSTRYASWLRLCAALRLCVNALEELHLAGFGRRVYTHIGAADRLACLTAMTSLWRLSIDIFMLLRPSEQIRYMSLPFCN
ncbi:hypothetical protein PG985_005615 [Apiospora marii]|uniref:uncharacterized protein n=1 Tax=Apiospora marii TaxID=335849 RepID=UPI00312D7625